MLVFYELLFLQLFLYSTFRDRQSDKITEPIALFTEEVTDIIGKTYNTHYI